MNVFNYSFFIVAIAILCSGLWLSWKGKRDCDIFLEKPIIALGVFLMVVSLTGIVGECCCVSLLLWIYLFLMFILIVVLFCFTIFAFMVTNKGAGVETSGRGYKEYRLGDYSNWLRKRVNSTKNWNKI